MLTYNKSPHTRFNTLVLLASFSNTHCLADVLSQTSFGLNAFEITEQMNSCPKGKSLNLSHKTYTHVLVGAKFIINQHWDLVERKKTSRMSICYIARRQEAAYRERLANFFI